MRLCACGCGRIVPRKWGRVRKFCSRACYTKALAGPAYAAFRRQRAIAASTAARLSHRRHAIERARRFSTKAGAYSAGYKVGFNAAYRWWKAKYQRDVRRAS